MSELTVPERFGKYVVKAILGRGAMGTVYRAFDPDIRRDVAVKTIRWDLVSESGQRESTEARFRNEARAAGRLSHPGIVAVYEFGQSEDCAFIAMEYVEGCSLAEYFARWTVFAEADIVSIMVQLLNALAHAHERKVWHRDVKPGNLILMKDGRLKVADFGIARIDAPEITQTDTLLGTPGYMPPEVYRHDAVDHRTDIFAAGAVMYELLAGRPLFEGTAHAKMRRVCSEERPPSLAGNSDSHWERYDPVICRALASTPSQRFETATSFRDAILALYSRPANETVALETIIARPPGGWRQDRAESRGSSGAKAGSTSGNTFWPPGWDPKALRFVEAQLAQIIGPMARVYVQRAARQCTDLDTLVNSIADGLDEREERRAFRSNIAIHSAQMGSSQVPARSIRPAGPARSGSGTNQSGLPSERIERVSRLLTRHIGPLARVIVKRASEEATDPEHFYRLVAERIPADSEREAFLREAQTAEASPPAPVGSYRGVRD
jgi:eukaryotic-like serine/threonine-protein kinase